MLTQSGLSGMLLRSAALRPISAVEVSFATARKQTLAMAGVEVAVALRSGMTTRITEPSMVH